MGCFAVAIARLRRRTDGGEYGCIAADPDVHAADRRLAGAGGIRRYKGGDIPVNSAGLFVTLNSHRRTENVDGTALTVPAHITSFETVTAHTLSNMLRGVAVVHFGPIADGRLRVPVAEDVPSLPAGRCGVR